MYSMCTHIPHFSLAVACMVHVHVFFQTILKSHVDSVNFYNEGGELETMCPPMICLRIQPRRGVPNLTEEVFKLKVVGVEDVSFRIMTGVHEWIAYDSIHIPLAHYAMLLLCR